MYTFNTLTKRIPSAQNTKRQLDVDTDVFKEEPWWFWDALLLKPRPPPDLGDVNDNDVGAGRLIVFLWLEQGHVGFSLVIFLFRRSRVCSGSVSTLHFKKLKTKFEPFKNSNLVIRSLVWQIFGLARSMTLLINNYNSRLLSKVCSRCSPHREVFWRCSSHEFGSETTS